MKQLTCEMCGSTDLLKQDGVFVCQSCGTKYSIEEAKKMMIEGTVDVSGSTVKVDTSGELANLYQIARRAKDDNNAEKAAKYYEMILMKASNDWEAMFYTTYFQAASCKVAEDEFRAVISVRKTIAHVFELIRDNIEEKSEKIIAVQEISDRCDKLRYSLNLARDAFVHNNSYKTKQAYWSYSYEGMQLVFYVGDCIESMFSGYPELIQSAISCWKGGILSYSTLSRRDRTSEKFGIVNDFEDSFLYFNEENKMIKAQAVENTAKAYIDKIKRVDPAYESPVSFDSSASKKKGCYVATCVYGSYDCPQVWTLRRYRDYTLAETWYGRAFIHAYYAISPTLVKWFGNTEWFKKMWKGKLDRMVADLQSKGVESTPYKDRTW